MDYNYYVCLEPCTIGGVRYNIGDSIPLDAIIAERAKALVDMGLIAPVTGEGIYIPSEQNGVGVDGSASAMNEGVYIPVTLVDTKGNEDEAVQVEAGEISKIFIVLQLNVENAVNFINENIDDELTLEVLERVDARKTVKNAIKEKTAQTAGEQ